MPTEIVMPNMGFDAQEARIIEWLKQPGEPVRRGGAGILSHWWRMKGFIGWMLPLSA